MHDRSLKTTEQGAAVILLFVLLVVMMSAAMHAMAITPPTPTAPKQASVVINWNADTLRADLVTPLSSSERKEARIYITSLSAYIAVPEPATTYTYLVPWGACVKATDSVQVTQVDTLGQEGAASDPKNPGGDSCSVGKPLPGK